MLINRKNYEHYLIDYLDGKLSKQDKEAVERFISYNPDIADELAVLSTTEALHEDIKDTLRKSYLYKSFNDITTLNKKNIDEFCIAYYEGDLDANSQQRLITYVKNNPDVQPLFELYGIIRMHADRLIRFPGKNDLRKVRVVPRNRLIYYVSEGVAAAAAIILLWIALPGNKENVSIRVNISAENTGREILKNGEQIQEIQPFEKIKQTRKSEVNTSGALTKQLAKIDSTDTRQPEKVVLAALHLRPVQLENKISIAGTEILKTQLENIQSEMPVQNEISEKPYAKRRFNSVIPLPEGIIYNAMNISIKGFNTLTESQLAVQTSQDNNGKLTTIAIDGDNFEFIRKIQRNNQN